ncbi:MAG TPA: hypothetical protein VFF79_04085 [Conexibacter sp.]|nr:hypothetical protein [Conexibacter sp.]
MSPLAALLAVAPALPLDKAGKYVAAAFVVFVGVVVIYVAIMGVKLQRMSRELSELNAALDMRAEAERSTDGVEAPPR